MLWLMGFILNFANLLNKKKGAYSKGKHPLCTPTTLIKYEFKRTNKVKKNIENQCSSIIMRRAHPGGAAMMLYGKGRKWRRAVQLDYGSLF